MESRLAREAMEAADGARRQLARGAAVLAELGRRLQAKPPPLVVTCARGSSDHAAAFGKYVIETAVGRLVASVGPSVASIYRRAPSGLGDALVIAVSQSGRTPDVLELTRAARRGGALVLGLVNDEASPLAGECDLVLPLCAGEECAVAATKSFLLAGVGFLQLAQAWTGDAVLRDAVAGVPELLDAAAASPWDLSTFASAASAYVVGRGVGLGPAQEMALKLKETCRLHAEAFSTAEVLHGPVALVRAGFPILALVQPDETQPRTREVIARLAALGAAVHATDAVDGTTLLPSVPGAPSLVAPLCHVQSFYLGLPALAAARGLNADAPAHLAKVTETL
jgi:glucosamine--fructose-6-phosphate aminotransferase (isomerizing)